MRTALLLATLLLGSTVALIAVAPTGSACTPPNCGGYTCHIRYREIYLDMDHSIRVPSGIDCYY
jgi:hypothetical protein